MTNLIVEQGTVKTVLVNVIVKVEELSQTALTVLECGGGEYQIKSNGADNKVVFVGLDKVFEVEAQIPEVVNCIGADFVNGILPVIFSVDNIPTDELEDFLESKIEPFEIVLLDSYFKLNEAYPVQILNFELQEEC